MDNLNGALETFGLIDVVRLIAAASRTGVLRVEAGPFTGRVFFVDGEVTYATTRGEDGSVSDLLRYTAERPPRERRGRGGRRKQRSLESLVRQQIVEVFVRLQRPDHGRFWFVEGVKTRAYGTEAHHRFSVDDVLEASDARREEWRSIEPLVPDGATEFRLRPRLKDGERDIEVAARDWEVLAAIGSGATVQDVAERMGVFEYSAARLTADLVERGLLVTAQRAEEIDREPRTVLLTVLPELADDQGAPTPVGPPA
jgi:hypothetical protein